ncbi:hypothetical protein Bca101_077603 [Brassica carinata]
MPAEIPSLQVGPLGHSFFAALMFFAGWFHYHKVENKEEIKGSYGECGQKSIKIVNSLALFTYSYRRRHLRRSEPQKRNPPPPLLTVSQCVSTTTSKLVEPFLGDSFHLRMAEQWFSAESLFPQLHTFANSAFRVFNLASSGRRDPPSSQLERTSSTSSGRHRQRVNRTLRLHRRGCLSPSQIRHRCPQSVIRGSVPRHQNVRRVEEVVSHIVHRSKLKRYFSSGEENNECPKMKSSRQHEALLLRY